MQYPLPEKIGNPELLVGREREFSYFGKWLAFIPKRLAKSHVILARRKSGKTAFVQRIFNMLWSANGQVIPFYFDIAEVKVWYPNFAMKYYRAFASQCISFLERNPDLVAKPLTLEEIREYGRTKPLKFFAEDVDAMNQDKARGLHDSVWETACEAPHRFAALHDRRVLVILDEFQNISQYIYRDEGCHGEPDESMAGSYHSLSESKLAPMLVTGSYVGWLLKIASKYLQAGRLKSWRMTPYLTPQEGLEAVYRYAHFYDEPITNEMAAMINHLCMADPFFISCVIQSPYPGKDLTTEEGVIGTVNYEITGRESEMAKTWGEYIELTLQKINDRHAKKLLLHLSKHNDREWTPRQLKEALSLDLDEQEIQKRLNLLAEADVIGRGTADIDYHGLRDGTLNLILRNRFEKEIAIFEPSAPPDLIWTFREEIERLRKEKRQLQGTLNELSGKMAEYQLANEFRSRKRFALSDYFKGVRDTTRLNVSDVRTRVPLQREDGKQWELDLKAESSCGRIVLVEVKKTQEKVGVAAVEDFCDKTEVYARLHPDRTILPAFLALGGFTDEALRLCEARGIATAERVVFW
jgi:hypothetical protein